MGVRDTTTTPMLEYAIAVPKFQPVPFSETVLSIVDRYRHGLFALLVLIYLAGFNGQWRLEPDSALYLTIGRNLAEGRGYTYHGMANRLAFPGPPLLFAGTFKLSGGSSLLLPLVVMLLMGAVALALTYRLFLLHAGRPTAVLVTFGLGISRLFYRYCFELLSDMPFLLGVMAFLAGFEAVFYARERGWASGPRGTVSEPASPPAPRWFDWALLIGGLALAVIMRPAMWALLVAIVCAVAWSVVRGKVRWPVVLVMILAVAAAGFAFWRLDPRHHGAAHTMGDYEEALFEVKFQHMSALIHQSLFEYLPRLFEASLSQALFGCRLGAGLNTLAGIAILVMGLSLGWRRPLWALWIVMTVVMVLIVVKPLDRYFLEVLPLLVYGWWRGIRWINRQIPGVWGNRIFLGLFLLGGATNLFRTGEFVIEQRWVPFRQHYKEGRFASTDRVVRLIDQNVKPGDWVLAPPKFGRILTFLTQRYVTEPTADTRFDLSKETVYVLEPLSDPVEEWLDRSHTRLSPPIGSGIRSRGDSVNWDLRRAEPGP